MVIRLKMPVPAGTPVSQLFGVDPQTYAKWGYAGHNGIDYAVHTDTRIMAAAPGIVAKVAFEYGGYGNYVCLDHGGYQTYYAHLNRALVEVGQRIEAGEVIALSDNTGASTGPHLHFGLKIPGLPNPGYKDYHNPWPYFAAVAADETPLPDTAMPLPVDGQLVVTAPLGLYVRSAPSLTAPAMGVIPLGTRITPQVMLTEWVEIPAYVHRKWVK